MSRHSRDLAGRVALVTGGSRGIGRAVALALAAESLRVVVGFRQDKDGALETAARCPGGAVVQIDVADRESVADAFDEVEGDVGSVAVLVNNAGLTRDRLLIRMREDDWQEVIDVNLTGAFRCSKRSLPGMLRAGWGRIVNVGSVSGLAGNAGQANYAAAKAGLVGFTKSLAREVARHGVTVNLVAPGLVDTAMTEGLRPEVRQALLDRIPMGRPGTLEEVADAVRFCVQASYVTGQVVVVDGGMV